MTQISVAKDEYYSFYYIEKEHEYGDEIVVTEEELNWIKTTIREFENNF